MLNLDELTTKESSRQQNTLNLIASENYPSPKVLDFLGSAWSTKYAEGQPGKRYYAGNELSDILEKDTIELALRVFNADGYGCNVQMLSGSPANATVYHAALEPGDLILSLSLDEGGHLSHMHSTSVFHKYYKFAHYRLRETEPNNFEIDIEDLTSKLQEHKPKLVILGFSSYPKHIDFPKLIELCHEYGALVLADIAHINGLVAAGLHSSPYNAGDEGADFVSMTTHKTLRGPRAGIIFAKDKYMPALNRAIFPGSFGGPHLNKIAALNQALQEITGDQSYPDNRSFEAYSGAVIENCKTLETELAGHGLTVISPTQNHLCLIMLPEGLDSLAIQQKLEQVGIITNRNMLPQDPKTPWRPSGLRLGSVALTSRGAEAEDFQEISKLIAAVIFEKESDEVIADKVKDMTSKLNWYYN